MTYSPTTHGMSRNPEYRAWTDLIQRCTNQNIKDYADYGARGVKVCKEWRDSFEQFYKDMGDRPSKNHSINRINNDGDYNRGNCHWATIYEQTSNRRNINKSGFFGVTQTNNRWVVQIGYKGKKHYVGTFSNVITAAIARNRYIFRHGFPHKLTEIPLTTEQP